MSLNSRIAIRDTYEARAVVIDYHVETRLRFTARPESTRNTIILEPETPRKDLMKQLPSLPEAEEEEVVNCKPCGPHVMGVLSYALGSSRNCRYRVTSIKRTGDAFYALKTSRLFETAVNCILINNLCTVLRCI